MLAARQFYVIEAEKLVNILPHFMTKSAVWIGDIFSTLLPTYTFKHAPNLLGQEFEIIFFDARQTLHLDAFAIASGTLKAGGVLLFVVEHWENWEYQQDHDSLRWSGQPHSISTPRFRHWFKQQIHHHFPQCDQGLPQSVNPVSNHQHMATPSQQAIIDIIMQQQSELYFLTAKRGRGKSALAGMLSTQLYHQGASIYLTAPNKNAVNILQIFAQQPLSFIAPDVLALAIQQDTTQFAESWLFVDEAATIPLDLLQQFCTSFRHILFTTTIHSYEGTGRGFKLKFMQKIPRTFQSLELDIPLRWAENDPLEQFVEQSLLLNAEDQLIQPDYNAKQAITYRPMLTQQSSVQQLAHVYGLLCLAHYRTTPTDLRRLFDAPKQHYWLAETPHHIIGCLWATEEGGIQDKALIEHIVQGKRRPRGNLVPQLLAFQTLIPDYCQLKSLRISRIAIQPKWQQQGIGSMLIAQMAQAMQSTFDFLSVSFGYTAELFQFWQQCGFEPAYLSDHKEASSGSYNMVMLKGLSSKGKAICRSAQQYFQRNIALSFHPLAHQFIPPCIDWQFTAEDMQSLKNFADSHRTLSSALPAIRRLLQGYSQREKQHDFPLLFAYLSHKKTNQDKKSWLAQCRLEIKRAITQNLT
ncbi:tRNA(Met) cytidine acetyltransferase TmcA [Conservatibacter flavescens]|uniref:tRNA(Met) cytidine acetyltransferase TmcA n=1 Tax=Conservatibacter flavescens TaxID=28161 RepID=A0A2M8S3R7_9PAST|nr:GNAT family N-acetyltransferase [Conservatibacter flavescens]PJG85792.1 hypothetical protein CVP05_04405 [Conservatibacter flavescens]